ncbi:unnamed protein product [Gadus morhua 'NCC']
MVRVHRSTACRVIRRVSLALSRRIARYVHLPNEEEAAAMKERFRQASGQLLRDVSGFSNAGFTVFMGRCGCTQNGPAK